MAERQSVPGWRRRLRTTKRLFRLATHRAISALRGGRGIPVRAAPGFRVTVHVDTYEDLRYWCRYEASTVQVLQRIWKPGMCVVDVGAHHGSFSVCCMRGGGHGIRLLSVEPSPLAWPALESNRSVHRTEDWTLHNVALSDAPGSMRLHVGWGNMLIEDPALHPGVTPHAVDVKTTTLDALCISQAVRPDLIKIDVEGLEDRVLLGAQRTLVSRPLVLLEWHRQMLRQRGVEPESALASLEALGYAYECYEPPEAGPVDTAAQCPDAPIVRLLCVPADA